MTDQFPQDQFPPAPPSMGSLGPLATFGQRAIAVIIDALVMFAMIIPVIIIFFILGAVSDALALIVGGLLYLAMFAAAIWYYIGNVGKTGQTPGRRSQGIRVVSSNGSPVGVGGAFIRWILASILNTFCYIGILWMLFDADKKTLYDKILDNQVVQVPSGEFMPIFPDGKPF